MAARKRYTDAKKREIVQFVLDFDAKNGRGGQAAAKKKYGANPISIKKWLGEFQGGGAPKATKSAPTKKTGNRGGRKPGSKPGGATSVTARASSGPVSGGGTNAAILAKMSKIQGQIDTLQSQFNQLKTQL